VKVKESKFKIASDYYSVIVIIYSKLLDLRLIVSTAGDNYRRDKFKGQYFISAFNSRHGTSRPIFPIFGLQTHCSELFILDSRFTRLPALNASIPHYYCETEQ